MGLQCRAGTANQRRLATDPQMGHAVIGETVAEGVGMIWPFRKKKWDGEFRIKRITTRKRNERFVVERYCYIGDIITGDFGFIGYDTKSWREIGEFDTRAEAYCFADDSYNDVIDAKETIRIMMK